MHILLVLDPQTTVREYSVSLKTMQNISVVPCSGVDAANQCDEGISISGPPTLRHACSRVERFLPKLGSSTRLGRSMSRL